MNNGWKVLITIGGAALTCAAAVCFVFELFKSRFPLHIRYPMTEHFGQSVNT